MNTETLATIGAISGLVALLLSTFNAWHAWNRDRVKLVVTTSRETWGEEFGAAEAVFSIKIENHGTFAVTIEGAEITFEMDEAPEIIFGQTVTRGEDTETRSLPLWVRAHQSITLSGGADAALVQQCCPNYAWRIQV